MNSLFSRAAVAGLLMGASVFASAADALKSQEPPKEAKVFIVSPADGATVEKGTPLFQFDSDLAQSDLAEMKARLQA